MIQWDTVIWTELRSGAPDRVIYGPCPVCLNWQLEADYSEDVLVLERIFLEHDQQDHPGALVSMALVRDPTL